MRGEERGLRAGRVEADTETQQKGKERRENWSGNKKANGIYERSYKLRVEKEKGGEVKLIKVRKSEKQANNEEMGKKWDC